LRSSPATEQDLCLKELLTLLNLLQDLLLNRDSHLLCFRLPSFLLQRSYSRVLTRGHDQERISSLSEVKVLKEGIGLQPQEGIVLSNLDHVVVALVHEWNVRRNSIRLAVDLSPSK
jgi:hypothetical protein